MPKTAINPRIARLEARIGERQEYVEFSINDARLSFIAQESGGWWLVWENDTRPHGPCNMLDSFPPGHKPEAVAAAHAAAEAYCARRAR